MPSGCKFEILLSPLSIPVLPDQKNIVKSGVFAIPQCHALTAKSSQVRASFQASKFIKRIKENFQLNQVFEMLHARAVNLKTREEKRCHDANTERK